MTSRQDKLAAVHHDVPFALKLLFPFLAVVVCFPVIPWIWERWFSNLGSPFAAILLMSTVVAWALMLRTSGSVVWKMVGGVPVMASGLCLALYALFSSVVPKLVSCALVASAFGFLMLGMLPSDRRRGAWALVPLVVLSLNLTPSIDFYAGYPLRSSTAWLSSLMAGLSLMPVGAGLTDGVRTVFVDAPCSGIRMLSAALVFGAGMALLFELSPLRTAAILAAALVLAVAGNALRAASLFIAGDWALSLGIVHSGIGIVVFAFFVAGLALIAFQLRTDSPPQTPSRRRTSLRSLAFAGWALFAIALASAVIASLNTLSPPALEATSLTEFKWPKFWQGQPLVPVLGIESGQQKGTPSLAISEFRLGETGKHILLRYSIGATRDIHPAEHCYRGFGWTLEPLPSIIDGQGRAWSRFRAIGPNRVTNIVSQCYFAVDPSREHQELEGLLVGSQSWPDASACFWATNRPGSSPAAVLAVTLSE